MVEPGCLALTCINSFAVPCDLGQVSDSVTLSVRWRKWLHIMSGVVVRTNWHDTYTAYKVVPGSQCSINVAIVNVAPSWKVLYINGEVEINLMGGYQKRCIMEGSVSMKLIWGRCLVMLAQWWFACRWYSLDALVSLECSAQNITHRDVRFDVFVQLVILWGNFSILFYNNPAQPM